MAFERSTDLLGDLGRLPNELLWQILDHVVMDTPRLTHAGYLTDERRKYIQNETHSLKCYSDIDDATDALGQGGAPWLGALPGQEPDLLTGIIRDDCLECFDDILGSLPDFPMMCYNEKGWSFLAVAVDARATKILRRFVTSGLPADTREFLFSKPHPGSIWTLSNLGMVALYKDADTFTALLQYLQNTMDPYTLKVTIESKLTNDVKRSMLEFMTPALRSMLDQGRIVVDLHQGFYHG